MRESVQGVLFLGVAWGAILVVLLGGPNPCERALEGFRDGVHDEEEELVCARAMAWARAEGVEVREALLLVEERSAFQSFDPSWLR